MNRNYIFAAVAVIVVIILGIVLGNRFKSRNLPNGQMTQPSPTTAASPSPIAITGKPQVQFTTSKGDFVIELRPDVAPKTVANFLNKWANGYCNDKIFHRVEDWVVQGCDPTGDGTGGLSNLPTETSSENFSIGAVGVARKQFPKEVSNDSQFFITKKDSLFLNGEYTYFGKVISGLEVINNLSVGDKIISTTILSK